MRGVITKRAVLLLAIVSAVSLVALAVLQYRWITELGASERALLDASLERGTRNFKDEFNTEFLTLVERTMRGTERNPEAVARRFRAAQNAIRHPLIVRALYLSEGPKLYQADKAAQPTPVEWPAHLQDYRDQAMHAEDDNDGPPPGPFWIESPPSIGLPRQPQPPPRPPERKGEGPPPERRSPPWVVFEFDSAYIHQQLIPELAAKHFGPDYAVEVVSSAEGSPPPGLTNPDATTGIFEVHVERPRQPGEPDRPPPRRDHPGAPAFESPRWKLLVKHQSGSLALQVAGVRRRNLAITLVVLGIMGLSSAALVVALNRAEQLNRMQMDFVAGVSHELRTPLSVIRSAGENLADGVVASEKQIRNYGALVRDEGKRLSTMVEQILRYAGVESGRAPYTFAPVAVDTLLERALEESKSALEPVEVEKRIEANLPKVMADEASLSHCLQNLLGNAVKYGDGKWVRVEASRKGTGVEFAVTDRGPGIEPSDRGSLFDPFYRGKRAVSDQIHGLGIGLSLVKRVAEAHGGRADVTNMPTGGARFSILIPIEPADSK